MSAGMEDLLAKFQAEALLRGKEWIQETMAEALEEEGAAADTEDSQPCAKRVRPLEHRSPSPVPRTLCRVSSPNRDPPGAATGQCPASEGLHPGKNADCDMKSLINMAHCEDEESSNSSDSLSEWAATAPDDDITSVEDVLAKVHAEALVRGPNCLQDTVVEILEDEGTAANTHYSQPCAKRVRPLEHRSPSPVPRTRCRISSSDRDPPGAATGQCPASEGLHPGRKLFRLDSDLQDTVNEAHDKDSQTLSDVTLQRDADSGPSSAVGVTVSMSDDESSVDHSGQDYISPLADSRPGQKLSAQLPDSGSSEGVPIPAHANRTVEVSDAIRMERLIQSCSAAVLLGQQHAARKGQQYEPIPVSLPAPDLRPRLVWILGNYFITSVYRRMSKIPDGRQLGFPRSKATIRWLEHEKLPWDDVIPAVSHYAKKYGHPDILIVHAGESELASTRTKELTQYIRDDLLKLKSILPLAVIVWSQMVCIRKRPAPYSGRRLDRACNKINNAVSIHLEGSGVVCINHSNLLKETSDLFKRSGLTLTLVGTKIFCTNLQEGIEKALQLWKQSHGVNA